MDKSAYDECLIRLRADPKTWLITGVAGFIGSNLLESLLKLNQRVVGIDNFSTGFHKNLSEVSNAVTPQQWNNFAFIDGDICNLDDCNKACNSVDYVLHQAAVGSVPRSIEDPITTNASNITGFLNILVAAKNAKVSRFIYAASSSTYGDHPGLPKVESRIGKPLSPYAVTKYVNELYADVFTRVYGIETVGLRYFNVFGPRQNPNGAYAAVIPKWIDAMMKDVPTFINGDGKTSRDFSYIDNVVQANLLAARASNIEGLEDRVFNIALGGRTSLTELHKTISTILVENCLIRGLVNPEYLRFRGGDVVHSQADISKAKEWLGYEAVIGVEEGLKKTITWFSGEYKDNKK